MTLLSKSGMDWTDVFSIGRTANAFSRSSDIVLLRKVLMRFKVEKHRSHSAVDMGVVQIISNSLYVSVNTFF